LLAKNAEKVDVQMTNKRPNNRGRENQFDAQKVIGGGSEKVGGPDDVQNLGKIFGGNFVQPLLEARGRQRSAEESEFVPNRWKDGKK
jgi:hypothetical protein